VTNLSTIRANELLRTRFRGGKVEFYDPIFQLEPRLKGRAIFRMSLYDDFNPAGDRDHGSFIFAGYRFRFLIRPINGVRTLTLWPEADLLMQWSVP